MDVAEVEENVFLISNAKLHGGMCKILSDGYSSTMHIFPDIEEALPRSRPGIQALCSLHISLENAKNIIAHCSQSSKIYLAVTGDSVLLKFERAKCSLIDSLKQVEDIVPQSIGCQLLDIVSELDGATLVLDPSEKKVGDEIGCLLHKGRRLDDMCNDNNEVVECFRKAASKLGINSVKSALMEEKALRKLVDRARTQEDKQKESIVAYLLNLMNKYSEALSSELSDVDDSPLLGTPTPSSTSTPGSSAAFGRQISKLGSFKMRPSVSFRAGDKKSGLAPVPPEELRCPISLQLMYDPVIISSGQTFEKKCIEKWFRDGHNTCPKTHQQLTHLALTPNYCVKGLIASWCEQHGVQVPDAPPESLHLNYWRLALNQGEAEAVAEEPRPLDNENEDDNDNEHESCKVKVVGLEVSYIVEEVEDSEEHESVVVEPYQQETSDSNEFEIHEKFLSVLKEEVNLKKKCIVVEQIRRLLKDDEVARVNMGSHGFVEALVQFLREAVSESDELAQEVGGMALFNIAVNNNRNKELMVSSELVPLLEEMIPQRNSDAIVAALSLNLSCLEEAKPILGSPSCKVVPFLISLLEGVQGGDPQSKVDTLHAIFNLSTCPSNVPNLVETGIGIVAALDMQLKQPHDHEWIDKSIAILIHLAGSVDGKEAIVSNESVIGELANILDAGEPVEQEQAAACLLILCDGNDKCAEIALQEGVIPSLVCLSVNGTVRGRTKAQRLLMLFREQRKPEPPPLLRNPQMLQQQQQRPLPEEPQKILLVSAETGDRPLGKSTSTRMMGRTFSFFRKNRNQSTRK